MSAAATFQVARGDLVFGLGGKQSRLGNDLQSKNMSDVDERIAYVKSEYDRWSTIVGSDDPYIGRVTIGIHEVLQAHFLLAEYFARIGEGIGGVGPKDINLLHSALSRQFVQFGGKVKWANRLDVCASLMFGLIKNHPFHDANKMTAFLISIFHLQKIGRTPTISHEAYENFTVAIADNHLGSGPIKVLADQVIV
jgi:death-on-curing protein